MRRLAIRMAAIVTILALIAGTGLRATEAANEPANRLDLAAMTLDGDDLPDGALLYIEQYLTPAQLASASGQAVPREELANAGLRWYYESRYVVPTEEEDDVRLVYRSYVVEFQGPAGVEAGFDLLEDEERFGLESAADEAAPEVGEEPREVTTGLVPPSLPESSEQRALYDLTFRVENVLAGVAVEALNEEDVDPAEVEDLARRLQERIEAVLAGEEIPGIDPALREALLPLEPRLRVQEGYQTAAEAPYTTTDRTTEAFAGYQSGYALTVAVNLETEGADAPTPYVTLALSSYESEAGPTDVLNQAGDLQSNLPKIEAVPDVTVEGADGAAAFRFSSPVSQNPDLDSYRLLLAVGDYLLAIDVQGAESDEAAESAALSLAEQQLACLEAGGQCPSAEWPTELGAPDA